MTLTRKIRIGAEAAWQARRLRHAAPGLAVRVARDAGNVCDLTDVIPGAGIRAVSFDFFDTLAFRRHLTLDQVQAKTAALAADLVPADPDRAARAIYAARGRCAMIAKRRMMAAGRGDEPRLADVFDRALAGLVPDADERARLAARLVALEAEIELRNLEPNEEAVPALRAMKAAGLMVLITSDMYFTGAEMARIVDAMGFAPFVDRLFVSADWGVTKARGGLYDVVARETGLPPASILHLGDNWMSDAVRARERGFPALHYVNAAEQGAERMATLRAAQPASAPRRRAQLSRRYGVADTAPLTGLDAIVDRVIGPACGLFVADVLMAAERRRASDIYFLTRDGTIFHDIARAARAAIPGLFGGGARLRLLSASRATGFFLDPRPTPGALIPGTEHLMQGPFTLARLFALTGVSEADLAGCKPAHRARIAAELETESEHPFRQLMAESPAFRAALAAAQGRGHALVRAYLAQEGLLAAENPVLADIGYSGSWAVQLSALAEAEEGAGRAPPRCEFRFFASNRFFAGNLRQLHPAIEMVPGFMIDHREGAGLRAALNFAWLEPFLVDPDHGVMRGYTPGPPIVADFAPPDHAPEVQAALTARRARIVDRAAGVIDDLLRHPGDLATLRDMVRDRLLRLADRPTRAEARAMAALTHQRGMAELAHQPIARAFWPNRLPAKVKWLRDNDFWVQGSLSLSRMGAVSRLMALHPALDPLPEGRANR